LKIQPYNPLALQVGHLTGLIGCWPGKVCKLPEGGSCLGNRRGGEGGGREGRKTWEVSAGFFTKSFVFSSQFLHQDGDLRFAFESNKCLWWVFWLYWKRISKPPISSKKES
jgi:hypothetical protein